MGPNRRRTEKALNKNGPRKLKSWPLVVAQIVNRTRLDAAIIAHVRDCMMITFPASNFHHHTKKNSNSY